MTYGGPAAGRGYWTKLANRRRHALQVGVHFRLVRASRSPHREPSAGRWSASPRVISCGSGRAFGQRSYHTISRWSERLDARPGVARRRGDHEAKRSSVPV